MEGGEDQREGGTQAAQIRHSEGEVVEVGAGGKEGRCLEVDAVGGKGEEARERGGGGDVGEVVLRAKVFGCLARGEE